MREKNNFAPLHCTSSAENLPVCVCVSPGSTQSPEGKKTRLAASPVQPEAGVCRGLELRIHTAYTTTLYTVVMTTTGLELRLHTAYTTTLYTVVMTTTGLELRLHTAYTTTLYTVVMTTTGLELRLHSL